MRQRSEPLIDDLGFDPPTVGSWFEQAQAQPFVLVHMREGPTTTWAQGLVPVLRRCYITDALVTARAIARQVGASVVIASRMPEPGSVMSGDFGEIVTYLYHASITDATHSVGVKKWRLKQDRRKPAPHSDVVHFVLPGWPQPTPDDAILCSEVKTKATDGGSTPIVDALEDSKKGKISRLANTLNWLRERALSEDIGDVSIEQLDRFIFASDHPPATKVFRAVAVVCSSLLDGELASVPHVLPADRLLVVIAVPELKATYGSLYHEAIGSLG